MCQASVPSSVIQVFPNKFLIKFVPIGPSPGSTHSKCRRVFSGFEFSSEFQNKLWIEFVIDDVVWQISASFQYNCAKNGKSLKVGTKEADTT